MKNDTLMLLAVAGLGFVLFLRKPTPTALQGPGIAQQPTITPSWNYDYQPYAPAPQPVAGPDIGGIIAGIGTAAGNIIGGASKWNTSSGGSGTSYGSMPDGWSDPW